MFFKSAPEIKLKFKLLQCTVGLFVTILAQSASSDTSQTSVYSNIPQPLRQLLCSNIPQNEQDYVERILKPIRLSGRNPDVLDQEDLVASQKRTLTTMRAGQANSILLADFDGDGKVTKDELIQKEIYFQKLINPKVPNAIVGQPNDPESKAIKAMQLDLNKDGFIDYDEMRNLDTKLAGTVSEGTSSNLSLLLGLAHDKQRLTKEELEKQARAAFAIVDLNHDTVLSSDECGAYKGARRGAIPAQNKGISANPDYLDSLHVPVEAK